MKLMDLIVLQEDHFQLEEHDLGTVVAEIEPALVMMAKERRVTIVTDLEEGKLRLEKDLIKILIFNLVDNALKASAEQQSITIRTYWRDNRCILEVMDQGIGIAEEHRDKIFEPFYMADKSRTRNSNGAGLGLAICQSVAGIHHAVIEVNSLENKGTTIRVIFERTNPEGGMNP